jgi:hypothetical protein
MYEVAGRILNNMTFDLELAGGIAFSDDFALFVVRGGYSLLGNQFQREYVVRGTECGRERS